jgi:hypothetical protein
MIPSTESPLKLPSSLDSIREEPSHPEKFKLLLSSSSPVNWLDTPSLKEPRLSLNTPVVDFYDTKHINSFNPTYSDKNLSFSIIFEYYKPLNIKKTK